MKFLMRPFFVSAATPPIGKGIDIYGKGPCTLKSTTRALTFLFKSKAKKWLLVIEPTRKALV
jgi:hypothetical protein